MKDIVVVTHRTRVNYGGIMAHMNVREKPLSVKEVRQALSYAIDRKLLVERAVAGLAEPASSPVSSLHEPWFNPAVAARYPFDPKKAEALLDQAGFKRGTDGKRFSIRLTYARADQGGALHAAAELMREQLRDDRRRFGPGAKGLFGVDAVGAPEMGFRPVHGLIPDRPGSCGRGRAPLRHEEYREAHGPQPDGLQQSQGG